MVMSVLRTKIKGIILVTLAAFVGLIFFDWGMQRSRQGSPIRFGMRPRLLYRIAVVSLTLATGAGCLALFPQVGVIALKQLAPELAELAYFGIGLQVLCRAWIL